MVSTCSRVGLKPALLTQRELHCCVQLSGKRETAAGSNRRGRYPLRRLSIDTIRYPLELSREGLYHTSILLQWLSMLLTDIVKQVNLLDRLVVERNYIVRLDVCRLVLLQQ